MKAFPDPNRVEDPSRENDRGMELRDYYAAKAMQGFIVSSKAPADSLDSIATNSYNMADAMIKQRNK